LNPHKKQNIYPLHTHNPRTCTTYEGQQTKDGSKNTIFAIPIFSTPIVHLENMSLQISTQEFNKTKKHFSHL
jgi:hypothetical protein